MTRVEFDVATRCQRAARVVTVAAMALTLGAGIAPWRMAHAAEYGAAPVQQTGDGWASYGGEPSQDHYSSLSQINRENVKRLKIAWTFDTGEKGSLETTPVIVGRVLYAYTPSLKVVALDAASGKLLWTFDSGVHDPDASRGVSYWTDGKESRVSAGMRNLLYALDPTTGKPIESVGEGGYIDLRKELRGDYTLQSIGLTSPGAIYKDLIIVGGQIRRRRRGRRVTFAPLTFTPARCAGDSIRSLTLENRATIPGPRRHGQPLVPPTTGRGWRWM